MFQNLEDPIQGESDRLVFSYFSQRYNKWMQGEEDDTEDLIAFEHDFMNLYKIDTALLRSLVSKKIILNKFRVTVYVFLCIKGGQTNQSQKGK